MQVNYEDPNLYEHLTLIVAEYEKAALRSDSRNGYLAAANGPLEGMKQVLNGADKALEATTVASTKDNQELDSENEGQEGREWWDLPEANVGWDIKYDNDLKELFGNDSTDAFKQYMRECLNCDFRVKFNWQLKPVDLLSPIRNLLKDINAALDSFSSQLDPFAPLENICELINSLKFFCIADLITAMMSLKMLLRNYLTSSLNLVLDWTAIIGPLLKVIIDGIIGLVNAVAGVIMGPLDCTISALRTINELQFQTNRTIEYGGQIINRGQKRVEDIATFFDNISKNENPVADTSIQLNQKDIFFNTGQDFNVKEKDGRIVDEGSVTGSLHVEKRSVFDRNSEGENRPNNDNNFVGSIPTEMRIHSLTLPEAVKDKDFTGASWTTKMLIALQDARNLIRSIARKIIGGLRSVQSLVSGGLGLQIGNLGILLFLKDTISLVVSIIKLLRNRTNVRDWCEALSEEPDLVRSLMAERGFNIDDVSINQTPDTLKVYNGPELVGEITTCLNKRDNVVDNELINHWIEKLKA